MTTSKNQPTPPVMKQPRAANTEATNYDMERILQEAIVDLQKGLFCRGTWFKDGGSHDLDFIFTEWTALVSSEDRQALGGRNWVNIPAINDWNLIETSRMMKCAEGAIAFQAAWQGFGRPVFERVRDLVNVQLLTFPHEEGQTYQSNNQPKCWQEHAKYDENGNYVYEDVVPGSPQDPNSPDYNRFTARKAIKEYTAELSGHNDNCLQEKFPDEGTGEYEVDRNGNFIIYTSDEQAIDNLVQLFAATIREQLGNDTYEPPARQPQTPEPVEIGLTPATLKSEAQSGTEQKDEEDD